MLSFSLLDENSISALVDKLSLELGDCDTVSGMLESFLEIASEGPEVAVTAAYGELLVRIYDCGRYSFVYPIEVGEETDTDAALYALADYSVRELIPFYLTDTPREELDRLRRLFSHLDARAYDDDEDSFVALVYSECDMLDDVPTLSHSGITLSRIQGEDMTAYAVLSRSEEVNRYWGYDYRDDESNADDEYFLRVAEGEFARGVAVSFAVREGGVDSPMLGEAVLFDFDYRGGAMAAVRILPEHWGRGIGTRAFGALVSIARDIGLKHLRAEVMAENLPSLAMTGKHLRRVGEAEGKILFSRELDR